MDKLADELDHFEFYVFPHTDTALCRESTRTDAAADPPSAVATYAQEVVLENWVAGAFATVTRFVPASIPALSKLAASGSGVSRKLDHSFRVFASERQLKFTEMEYCVPRANAREAVEGVLEIANRRDLKVAFPIEVRFVAADDAMLSPSFERDSCYVAVHFDRHGEGHKPYFDAVESLMARFGGRPALGQASHPRDDADLRGLYPRFGDFLAVRERLDPGGAFANEYTERVLGPVVEPVAGRSAGGGRSSGQFTEPRVDLSPRNREVVHSRVTGPPRGSFRRPGEPRIGIEWSDLAVSSPGCATR